ncbi:unnamed protein product [Lathyrus oleraceus]
MGAGLKKDLRLSLNVFFFLLIRVIPQRLVMIRKKGKQAHLESAVQRIVDGPAAPWKRLKDGFDSFMHAPTWLRGI